MLLDENVLSCFLLVDSNELFIVVLVSLVSSQV